MTQGIGEACGGDNGSLIIKSQLNESRQVRCHLSAVAVTEHVSRCHKQTNPV